jgi:hypothetical protein
MGTPSESLEGIPEQKDGQQRSRRTPDWSGAGWKYPQWWTNASESAVRLIDTLGIRFMPPCFTTKPNPKILYNKLIFPPWP